jgi:hypothetical protein
MERFLSRDVGEPVRHRRRGACGQGVRQRPHFHLQGVGGAMVTTLKALRLILAAVLFL